MFPSGPEWSHRHVLDVFMSLNSFQSWVLLLSWDSCVSVEVRPKCFSNLITLREESQQHRNMNSLNVSKFLTYEPNLLQMVGLRRALCTDLAPMDRSIMWCIGKICNEDWPSVGIWKMRHVQCPCSLQHGTKAHVGLTATELGATMCNTTGSHRLIKSNQRLLSPWPEELMWESGREVMLFI